MKGQRARPPSPPPASGAARRGLQGTAGRQKIIKGGCARGAMVGTPVCKDGDIAEGSMARFKLGDRDIAVANLGGGEIVAFDDTCTHAGASLAEGRLESSTVVCGWHGARFGCRTGELEQFPAKIRGLRSYPVTVESGQVCIEV